MRRRCCLQIGLLGWLGGTRIAGPGALLNAAGDTSRRADNAILIWLGGGPSHHDTLDPKPLAAAEVRGEFNPIETSVRGIRIAETLPRLAQQMRHVAILRAVSHRQAAHEPGSAYMISGHRFRPGHQYASVGAVVGHQHQQRLQASGLSSYMALPDETIRGGGHLGVRFNPFSIPGDPSAADFQVQDLSMPADFSRSRLLRRRALSQSVNREFSKVRNSPVLAANEKYATQAYDLIQSSRAQQALDINREPSGMRDRYGRNALGQRMLLARRLIEVGVPFLTVRDDGWDDHRNIFPSLKQRLPLLDCGLSALIEDLHDRGLLDRTLVCVAGEFGRTARINATAGRDHWSQAFSVALAGGGVGGGKVIGASDAAGAFPQNRPVTPEELYYSVYTLLGIAPETLLMTSSGREVPILQEGEFIPELTS